jgi:hypothetical protein
MVSWWGVALIGCVCFGAGLLFGLVFKSIGARHDRRQRNCSGGQQPANLMAEACDMAEAGDEEAASGRNAEVKDLLGID